jgi:hypothetical protein
MAGSSPDGGRAGRAGSLEEGSRRLLDMVKRQSGPEVRCRDRAKAGHPSGVVRAGAEDRWRQARTSDPNVAVVVLSPMAGATCACSCRGGLASARGDAHRSVSGVGTRPAEIKRLIRASGGCLGTERR